jgi:hypothetical protein
VYAHNGGKFDWRFLEQFISEGPVRFIGGRLVEARIGRAILRDSYSLLPASLESITGQKIKIDYRKFERKNRARHLDEIREYLRNDCEILFEVLSRFFTDYGRPLTLAGATLAQWRKLGGEVPKFGPRHFEQFQRFYHGGRCEAIQPGTHKGKQNFLEINGAYAHAMSYKQWHGLAAPSRRCAARDYDKSLFVVEAESFGALPLRDDVGNLSFPHAKGQYQISGRELASAIDLRLVRNVKIIECYQFSQWTNFREYVLHFEQLRQEAKKNGDELGNQIAKLFRNGIYGKMAANPNKYRKYYLTRLGGKPPRTRAQYSHFSTLDNAELWACQLEDWEKTFYDVSLGAQITGHVRAILMESLATVKEPLYCDTDSIICHGPGKLKIGTALGQWKIEATGTEVVIAGKKLYAFRADNKKWKVASKGARLRAAQIKKLAAGETVRYRQPAQSVGLHGSRNIERNLRSTAKKR